MTIKQSKIVDAIFDTGGRLSSAARQIGCSLKTLYNHRGLCADVAPAIIEARQCSDCELLDTAELKLRERVEADGDDHHEKSASLASKSPTSQYLQSQIAHDKMVTPRLG